MPRRRRANSESTPDTVQLGDPPFEVREIHAGKVILFLAIASIDCGEQEKPRAFL
jgi:hypothetical protein